jgi:tetratricopeptide (TPR) repeat protein
MEIPMNEMNADETEVAALDTQADCHFVARDYRAALDCQLRAIAIRKANRDWIGAGNGTHTAGYLRFLLADHAGALKDYREALEIRRRVNDFRGQAITLGRMGEVFQQIGEHAKAVELLDGAVRLFAKINAIADIGTALNNMAVSYRETGEFDMATKCYDRSLEIRRQIGDFKGLAATLHNLSVLYSDQGRDIEARLRLEEALEVREAMKDARGTGQTLLQLGALHEKWGDLSIARTHYERALRFARQEDVQSKEDEGTALLNLADVLSDQGETEQALGLLDEAEKLFTERGMYVGVAMTNYGRGRTFAGVRCSQEALACFEQAKLYFARLNDRPRLVSTYVAIGAVLSACGRHDEAREAFRQSFELKRQLPRDGDGIVKHELLMEGGEVDGAEIADRTATVDPPAEAAFCNGIGVLVNGRDVDSGARDGVAFDWDSLGSAWKRTLH